MEETLTETELRNTLTDLGWSPSIINKVVRDLKPAQITCDQLLGSLTVNETNPAAKTKTVMDRIMQLRHRRDSQVPFDEQVISRAELKRTLDGVLKKEHGIANRLIFSKAYFSLDALVNDLFRNAPQPEEPEYRAGHVYRDVNGKLWQRGYGSKWAAFGDSCHYDDATPTRPLTEVTV